MRAFSRAMSLCSLAFDVELVLEIGVLVSQLVSLQPCLGSEGDDVEVAG
jgi:hypothetical protein